ncbi:MAG TPA: gamma-butyrobetaine hydroxylase-like domain-containing protein [Candidatus Binatia bacterium]|jgi:DUF971 family protein|nr:gamma-butyrobetaine hydroxylase-like domain-containing protein [Candidatus Binatia bacterium]
MPSRPPEATHVERFTEVGRYALGVQWADRHDSILPYATLRRACPCEACVARGDAAVPPEAERLVRVETLGDRSVFLEWADGHETILLLDELRDLCRCARCVAEPEFPVSG